MNDLRVGASLVGGGLVLAALVVGGGYWALDGGLYGCTRADRRLQQPVTAEVRALGAPQGAHSDGEPYAGCDDDDRFAYYGQGYDEPARRADVVAHYRAAAARNGWQRPARPGRTGLAHRPRRRADRPLLHQTGRRHHRPPRGGLGLRRGRGYTVEVRASRTGGAWCA
ncbi:hypothetical protein ACFQ1I_13920 [Kitasatospora arboriphila]